MEKSWQLVTSNDLEHDFAAAWKQDISKPEWENFLLHTFNENNRPFVYNWLKEYVSQHSVASFAEIGFGQCLDFVQCFRELHDKGNIVYKGYEVTSQFTDFANETYPGYSFETKDFLREDTPCFDITYARHVFEHQPPSQCYSTFETLLRKTNNICIIAWFRAPNKEEFLWVTTDGFGQSGAYVNTYDLENVKNIIKQQGFKLEIIEVGQPAPYNTIYFIKRM